jgi:hypothetical protein
LVPRISLPPPALQLLEPVDATLPEPPSGAIVCERIDHTYAERHVRA